MKHFDVQRFFALCSALVRAASGASQSEESQYSDIEPQLQDTASTLEFGTADPNGLVQNDDFEIVQHQRQTLLQRFRQVEAIESQARRAMAENNLALNAMQQEQQFETTRISADAIKKRSLRRQAAIKKQSEEDGRLDSSSFHRVDMDTNPPVISYKETDAQFWDEKNKQFKTELLSIGCYMITICLFGVLYKEFIKRSKFGTAEYTVKQPHPDEFEYGLMDMNECCGKDMLLCCCAWCCSWIRWADTASNPKINFLEFYPALFMVALLSAMSMITFGASLPLLGLVVVLCRSRIRKVYGLPSGGCSVLSGDCCRWIFCPCCAIAQEARQAEYVNLPGQGAQH